MKIRMIGTLFICIGALCLVVGLVINITAKNETESSQGSSTAHDNQRTINEVEESEQREVYEKDFKQMGNSFEGYVADIINMAGGMLKEWNQGATSKGGVYAENELSPDMLVSHKINNSEIRYWVECKYRSYIPKEGFELEEKQLNRYASKQGSSKKKVLIALGVGGKAEMPREFYLIPVDSLKKYKHIPQYYLNRYKIDRPEDNFKSNIEDYFFNKVFKKK